MRTRVQSSSVRYVSLALAAGLAAVGCGLDSSGLQGDEAGVSVEGGGSIPFDGGSDDATAAGHDGPSAFDGSSGRDVTLGGGDTGSSDSGTETDSDAAMDTGETGPDATPVESGPSDDACASAELCNNGIDDNCDGRIDCADPECMPGWSCTAAAVPAGGWSVVEYAENARPACPANYATSADVLEGPEGSPATCGCQCNVTTPGSCETGSFPVFVGSGAGCALLPSATNTGNNGACTALPIQYTPGGGAKFQINPLGYTAGSCTPAPNVTTGDAGAAAQGRACRDSEGTGGGCANGAVCAPVGGSDFAQCIMHTGVTTCPPGFPTLHAVGAGLADGRGCSACSCGTATATCANAKMSLFTDGGCDDAGGITVPADGKCDDVPNGPGGGNPTYVAYEYAAQTQSEGCVATPGTPDGGVTLTQPRTICCQ